MTLHIDKDKKLVNKIKEDIVPEDLFKILESNPAK